MRSPEALKRHYEIEHALAEKLRRATRTERRTLYREAYDELFRRVPDHPQHAEKADPKARAKSVAKQMRLLSLFLSYRAVFLEIGAGDGALSAAVAPFVKRAIAVDVSNEISRGLEKPRNMEFLLTDGLTLPLGDASVSVAYSYQLMEHLHPEDAADQLTEIVRVLAPGGYYVCVTPSRYSGPHDISHYFDDVATGFHLKEYSVTELEALFLESGFRRVKAYVGGKGWYAPFPVSWIKAFERTMDGLPKERRQRFGRSVIGQALFGVILVGER